jgi:hypothetical protein
VNLGWHMECLYMYVCFVLSKEVGMQVYGINLAHASRDEYIGAYNLLCWDGHSKLAVRTESIIATRFGIQPNEYGKVPPLTVRTN